VPRERELITRERIVGRRLREQHLIADTACVLSKLQWGLCSAILLRRIPGGGLLIIEMCLQKDLELGGHEKSVIESADCMQGRRVSSQIN
jgi:hypothetical protein